MRKDEKLFICNEIKIDLSLTSCPYALENNILRKCRGFTRSRILSVSLELDFFSAPLLYAYSHICICPWFPCPNLASVSHLPCYVQSVWRARDPSYYSSLPFLHLLIGVSPFHLVTTNRASGRRASEVRPTRERENKLLRPRTLWSVVLATRRDARQTDVGLPVEERRKIEEIQILPYIYLCLLRLNESRLANTLAVIEFVRSIDRSADRE